MSYRVGVNFFGRDARAPRVLCDSEGCDAARPVAPINSSRPYAWFLNGRPAPGWSGGRTDAGGRRDFCPACSDGRGR